jgi:hypothetical protein
MILPFASQNAFVFNPTPDQKALIGYQVEVT